MLQSEIIKLHFTADLDVMWACAVGPVFRGSGSC